MISTTYKVIQKDIGKGGFGSVSLVQNQYTNQRFACKTLVKGKQKLFANDAYKSAVKEIKALQRLKGHKEIIQLHEVIEDDNAVHLVIENCPGGTLTEYVSKMNTKYVSEDDVRKIMEKSLHLLETCHANNVIHNDVKAENFILGIENDLDSLKLIDFGSSVFEEEKASYIFDVGTPWYTSPECLTSKVCTKSDVWSIGIMAYYLFVDAFPFNDKRNLLNPCLYRIWKSVLNDPVRFYSSQWVIISEEAKDFIELLLTKDVNKRPSVQEALNHPWIKQ
jgi:serine/threonine protein kinase